MINTVIIMSLFCVAIYELQSHGLILHPIRQLFDVWRTRIDRGNSRLMRVAYIALSKPITSCVICFASFWGSTAYFMLGKTSIDMRYILLIIICSLFNYIIYCLVKILEKV